MPSASDTMERLTSGFTLRETSDDAGRRGASPSEQLVQLALCKFKT